MFLHLSVILFMGEFPFPQCHGAGRLLLRQNPHPPPLRLDTGGTYPTGMHTCLSMFRFFVALNKRDCNENEVIISVMKTKGG